MKTLNEIIEQAKNSLPECKEYQQEEIKVVTSLVPPRVQHSVEHYIFIFTFGKAQSDSSVAWELKDVETRTKAPDIE